jgi:glycosyltransferase involved in cell wall biosynthesis
MNIVLYPSWYPRNKEDMRGSFFREQAIALKNNSHKIIVFAFEMKSFKGLLKGPLLEINHYVDDGINVYSYGMTAFFPNKFFYLFNWHELILRKIIFASFLRQLKNSQIKIDVIHAHSTVNAGFSSVYASKKHHIPLVVTEHLSRFLSELDNKNIYKQLRYTVTNSAKFIFVSKSFKNTVTNQLQYESEKIMVIPNMVDTNRFMRLVKKNDKFCVLVVCGQIERKGVRFVIEAFELAFNTVPNAELHIVGNGEEHARLIQIAQVQSSKERIKFFDSAPRSEVPKLMCNSSLFVMTSNMEPFGVVYLEAISCGIPIIGTKGQGVEDIVTQSNGCLVEYGNVKELADAMSYIYHHYDAYDHELIRNDAIRRFSQESVAKKISAIYESVCH